MISNSVHSYNKIPYTLWFTIIVSVLIPISLDLIFQDAPLSVYLLYLLPCAIFPFYYNLKGSLIGMLFVSAVHISWGIIILPNLYEKNLAYRMINHFGLIVASCLIVLLLAKLTTKMKTQHEQLRESEELYRNVVELSPNPLIIHQFGKIVYANPAAIQLSGFDSSEELLQYSIDELMLPPSKKLFDKRIKDFKDGIHSKEFAEYQMIKPNGQVVFLESLGKIIQYQGKEAVLAVGSDITTRKEREERLRKSETLLAEAERLAHLGSWEYDVLDGKLYWSDETYRIFGVSRDNFVPSYEAFLQCVPPEEREQIDHDKNRAMSGVKSFSIEHRIVRADGQQRYIQQHAKVKFDEQGQAIYMMGTIQDITEKRQTELELEESLAQIKYMVFHDDDTNLLNRRGLNEIFENKFKSFTDFSVLFLDLDNFKHVNDSFGHHIGDKLLIKVAQLLKQKVNEKGVVARFGGDEFVILVRDSNDSSILGNEIIGMLSQPFHINKYRFYITTSIGIANYPDAGTDMESLIKSADNAMYRAKQSGKNTFRTFDSNIEKLNARTFLLQHDLRSALDNEEFTLYYQPRIQAGNLRMIGVEALVRWEHPTLGLISPSEFIPIAEESGLIIKLGEWVLATACKQLVAWDHIYPDELKLSVNFSTVQFMQIDLNETVMDIIRKYNICPSRIEVEITESAVFDQDVGLRNNVIKLKDMGIKVAIDDFGTGYSSLRYIKKFYADIIKIDRSFIYNLEEDEDIVIATITLAKALGLNVVAEGVETVKQVERLVELGCDELQGFYFAKPLPSNKINELLLLK